MTPMLPMEVLYRWRQLCADAVLMWTAQPLGPDARDWQARARDDLAEADQWLVDAKEDVARLADAIAILDSRGDLGRNRKGAIDGLRITEAMKQHYRERAKVELTKRRKRRTH